MKILGNLLLATWLILTGLRSVIDLHFRYDSVALGILAIVVGIVIAIGR